MHTIVDWAQIIGALAAVIAIWFAVRAQRDASGARREVAAERRRQVELEILRELLAVVDSGGFGEYLDFFPERTRTFSHRLALLPSDDLPFWRTVMEWQWRQEATDALGFTEAIRAASVKNGEIAKRGPGDDEEQWRAELKAAQEEIQAVNVAFEQAFYGRLSRELLEAITARVEAGRFD